MTSAHAFNQKWVFDPVPPSGSRSGGDPTEYIFRTTLDTFVREVLQNTHDQQPEGAAEPARAAFTFHYMTEGRKAEFLDALGWASFSEHLQGVASSKSLVAGVFKDALTELEENGLLILKIEDSGTKGLEGEEDDHSRNFAALTRDTLVTTDKDKTGKGGSHGLGKAVLPACSSFSTVLFSSTIEREGERRFRLIGRCDLPYHESGGKEWAGPGWFGNEQEAHGGTRAVSVWDDEATQVALPLELHRDPDMGTGTSIVIFGFRSPGEEEQRPAQEVAREILKASARSFWPALAKGTLEVTASVYEDGVQVFADTADIGAQVSEFHAAATEPTTGDEIRKPGDVAERTLEVRIPARKQTAISTSAPETNTAAVLRLVRAGPGSDGHDLLNRVALIRGAGMVVQYWTPRLMPAGGEGFFGVLLAGRAAPEGTAGAEALEDFLRAAEPPKHDEWVHNTRQLQSCYQPGSQRRLRELFDKINGGVLEMAESRPPDEQSGPQLLAKLFPLGTGPGTNPRGQRFKVDFEPVGRDSDGWTIRGKIKRLFERRTWHADVGLWLDGETGRGDRLGITTIDVLEGEASADLTTDGGARITALDGVETVLFQVRGEPSEEDRTALSRARVRATVHPVEGK